MTDYLRRANFEKPIVQTLEEMGDWGFTADVMAGVEQKMRHRMTAADYALAASKGRWSDTPRWKLETYWARDDLVKAGIILSSKESGHGTWRLAKSSKRT